MNKPIRIKIAQYILSTLLTLFVCGTIIIVVLAVIGNFLDNSVDIVKKINSLITGLIPTLFFYIPYFKLFMMPRRQDRLLIELSISKNNIDMKNFIKTNIKSNWKSDILMYAISGLPVLIFGRSSVTALFSPQQLFFYVLTNIRIISYLLSIIFFCIGYTLCLALMYRSLAERSTE